MTELHATLAPRDPMHGRFFEHQPASARVTIAREGSHASVALAVAVRITDMLGEEILIVESRA